MTSNQVTATNFDAGNVSCTEPKLNKKKRLQAYLLYDYGSNKNKPLYLETPEAMICPFGLSKYEAVEGSGKYSYSLPMTRKSSIESEQPVVVSFFEQLQALDEFMIDYGVRFSKKIFGKEYTEAQRELVKAFYTPLVKDPSVNKETGEPYPLKISPKIPKVWEDPPTTLNGVPELEVYTSSEEDQHPESWEDLEELLPNRVPTTGILRIRPWFVNKKYGLSMTLMKVKAMPVEKNEPPRGYSFSRPPVNDETEAAPASASSESGVEAEVSETVEASASGEEASASGEEVVDSEDGEELEDEEVEEVEVSDE